MKVKVLKKHIDNGIRKAPAYCPIALAIRACSEALYVEIDQQNISFKLNGERQRFKTPKSATDFICRFDKKKPVKPFTFTL